jgi:hypothetical protein
MPARARSGGRVRAARREQLWRGWRGGDFVEDAREDIRESLQNIPVEDLHIWLDGERVNEPSSSYARTPTIFGPLRLSAHTMDRKDLLLTKNNLPLACVSSASTENFFPDAPKNSIDILFAGGIVLDLPPGLPLTRTRNALAADALQPWLGRFLFLLTHESVHLLERRKSPTHDERFYRRQRRLLEQVLLREDDFMAPACGATNVRGRSGCGSLPQRFVQIPVSLQVHPELRRRLETPG